VRGREGKGMECMCIPANQHIIVQSLTAMLVTVTIILFIHHSTMPTNNKK